MDELTYDEYIAIWRERKADRVAREIDPYHTSCVHSMKVIAKYGRYNKIFDNHFKRRRSGKVNRPR